MNKTRSIILIVVACIVVLGGTYWYFGMQKPKTQEGATTPAVVDPVKKEPTVAKESPIVPPPETSSPKAAVEQKQKTATAEKPTMKDKDLPTTVQKVKPIPSPVAPVITMAGGFSLPTLEVRGEEGPIVHETRTSVLVSETLPERERTQPLEEDVSVLPSDLDSEDVAQGVELALAANKTVESQPEAVTTPSSNGAAIPPTNMILRSETGAEEKEKPKKEKPAMEGSLSVSFLDYNFPKDFSTAEKGFNVSLDIMSQKEMFGWGATLEVGKNTTADIVQVSLLARGVWRLGEGRVTFPLSVSLGPTLFIDSTANTTEFGIKGKLGAGVNYAISESFRIFYAIGVGATYNFKNRSLSRFVLEPIRVGVGFSF
ncbi:MAG: hypothetical protein PHR69_00590 [Sphaerochaeta sp.]|nr:hypothetical protein [Sphaerochaeta sp.]